MAKRGSLVVCLLSVLAFSLPLQAQWWKPNVAAKRVTTASVPAPRPGRITVNESVADPVGDASGTGSPIYDVTNVSANSVNGNVVIRLTLAQAPTFTGSAPTDFVGAIDIDADQNASTGSTNTATNAFCTSGLGVEYYVSLFSYDPSTGLVPVFDANNNFVLNVPETFGADYVEVSIPASLFGAGGVDIAAVIGNRTSPTDCAPQAPLSATVSLDTVPALDGKALAMLVLALAATGAFLLRIR